MDPYQLEIHGLSPDEAARVFLSEAREAPNESGITCISCHESHNPEWDNPFFGYTVDAAIAVYYLRSKHDAAMPDIIRGVCALTRATPGPIVMHTGGEDLYLLWRDGRLIANAELEWVDPFREYFSVPFEERPLPDLARGPLPRDL